MGLIFKDDLHNEFGTWPLAYIPYGGADFGEVAAVARAVGEGDDSALRGSGRRFDSMESTRTWLS